VIRQIPKVLASFVLGFLLMFTGSLVYSKVHQRQFSLEAPLLTLPAHTETRAAYGIADVDPSHKPLSRDEQDSSTGTSGNISGAALSLGDVHPARGVHSVATEPSHLIKAGTGPLELPVSNPAARAASVSRSYLAGESKEPDKSDPGLLPVPPPIVSGPQLTTSPEMPYVPNALRGLAMKYPQKAPAVASQSSYAMARPDTKPDTITVAPGTGLAVRLAEPLSSDRNRTGQTFRATLASSLAVNGFIVAAGGSTVLGRIVQARRAPLLGGKSDLTLVLTNITDFEGKLVSVDSNAFEEQGSRSNLLNTAKMATGAAVGAAIGAVTGAAEGAGISSSLRDGDRTNGFMATKRTVVLPAGMQITFSLTSPLAFTQPRGKPGLE
jgi:hypothetical protein